MHSARAHDRDVRVEARTRTCGPAAAPCAVASLWHALVIACRVACNNGILVIACVGPGRALRLGSPLQPARAGPLVSVVGRVSWIGATGFGGPPRVPLPYIAYALVGAPQLAVVSACDAEPRGSARFSRPARIFPSHRDSDGCRVSCPPAPGGFSDLGPVPGRQMVAPVGIEGREEVSASTRSVLPPDSATPREVRPGAVGRCCGTVPLTARRRPGAG